MIYEELLELGNENTNSPTKKCTKYLISISSKEINK
jgi:hypothetical protein